MSEENRMSFHVGQGQGRWSGDRVKATESVAIRFSQLVILSDVYFGQTHVVTVRQHPNHFPVMRCRAHSRRTLGGIHSHENHVTAHHKV